MLQGALQPDHVSVELLPPIQHKKSKCLLSIRTESDSLRESDSAYAPIPQSPLNTPFFLPCQLYKTADICGASSNKRIPLLPKDLTLCLVQTANFSITTDVFYAEPCKIIHTIKLIHRVMKIFHPSTFTLQINK